MATNTRILMNRLQTLCCKVCFEGQKKVLPITYMRYSTHVSTSEVFTSTLTSPEQIGVTVPRSLTSALLNFRKEIEWALAFVDNNNV